MSGTSEPLISVVVTVYNKAPYIRRCLESIQNQTFRDFEIVVIDDGSVDHGSDIARAYLTPKDRLIAQANGGSAAARNRGIRCARAGLVALLDADDEWYPGFLEVIYGLVNRFPNAGMFATGYRTEYVSGGVLRTTIRERHPVIVEDYFRRCRWACLVNASNVVIKREVLTQSGGFAEGCRFGEDLDLWARIATRHKLAFDPQILSVYHRDVVSPVCESYLPTTHDPLVVQSLLSAIASDEMDSAMANAASIYAAGLAFHHAVMILRTGNRSVLREYLQNSGAAGRRGALSWRLMRTIAKGIVPWSVAKSLARLVGSRWGVAATRPTLIRSGLDIRYFREYRATIRPVCEK